MAVPYTIFIVNFHLPTVIFLRSHMSWPAESHDCLGSTVQSSAARKGFYNLSNGCNCRCCCLVCHKSGRVALQMVIRFENEKFANSIPVSFITKIERIRWTQNNHKKFSFGSMSYANSAFKHIQQSLLTWSGWHNGQCYAVNHQKYCVSQVHIEYIYCHTTRHYSTTNWRTKQLQNKFFTREQKYDPTTSVYQWTLSSASNSILDISNRMWVQSSFFEWV